MSEIEQKRALVSQLERMEQAKAELSILEKKEAQRLAYEQAKQSEAELESRFIGEIKAYRLEKNKRDLELEELAKQLSDVIRRRQLLDKRGAEVIRLAEQLARLRIDRGAVPGGGTWGRSYNENVLVLQTVRQQILQEQDYQVGIVKLKDSSDATRALLSIMGRFCQIAVEQTPRANSRPRVMISTAADDYWE